MDNYAVLVWVPNEPTPYKITFYADDAHHALEQYLDHPFPFADVISLKVLPVHNLEETE